MLRLMGLDAIYPKPKLSAAGAGHRIYPYLLRGVSICRPDQVWSTEITYVPLARVYQEGQQRPARADFSTSVAKEGTFLV